MIIEKARELGEELANSPEFIRVINARKNVEQDESLKSLIQSMNEKKEYIVSLMQKEDVDNTIIMETTADYERIQNQLYENPLFYELLQSEDEFQQLVYSANKEINACIGIYEEEDKEFSVHCTGDCGGCSGCNHSM